MDYTPRIQDVSLMEGRDYASEIREIIQFEGNNTCADCVSPSN